MARKDYNIPIWLAPGDLQIPPQDNPVVEPPPNYIPCTCGSEVMNMIYCLLQLAVKHTDVFERWKVIWNMYLEKDPGKPQIDQL